MDRGVAEGGDFLGPRFTIHTLKHRPTIAVRGRFPQRLIGVHHLAAEIGQRTRCVTLMRQNESRGNRSRRTRMPCTGSG